MISHRFCNIDFILLCAVFPFLLLRNLFISYDIACQYKKKFFERMAGLPQHLRLSDDIDIQWGIPKCHNPAHKVECQAPHSLNFKKVGRTDGEGIERSWAETNLVANSTKEMGPGSRHDTLDDHFGHHNWRKMTGLGMYQSSIMRCFAYFSNHAGPLMHSRLAAAIPEAKRQKALFAEFTESVDPKLIEEWTDAIIAWEEDNEQPNPYVSSITRRSFPSVVSTKR